MGVEVNDSLRKGLRALRLSTLLSEWERLQEDPGAKKWSFDKWLNHLVWHELKVRETRAIERRITEAGFPFMARLEDYDFRRMPDLDDGMIRELHECAWIERGDNLVYSGGHGLGKTHLSISNGIEACEKGYRVLFKKAEQLVLELLEAREEKRVLSMRRKLMQVDLVVLDEVGYTPFDRAGGELLHGVICDRYDAHKSVLVTTNLEFGRWVEIFKSKEMTVALLDRLTHRCDVVVMKGKSKRYEESLERQRRRQLKKTVQGKKKSQEG
jgi:DNA replication protein DnaC